MSPAAAAAAAVRPALPEVRGDALDLRLAAGAGAAWIGVLSCLNRPVGQVVACAGGALASGLLLVTLARRRPWAASGALALFAGALALAPLAGRIVHARAGPLVDLARQHASVTAHLTVTGDPRKLAATGPGGSARIAVEASADAVVAAGTRVPTDGSVLVLADAGPWRDMLPGQRVVVSGRLAPDLSGSPFSVTLFARGPPVRVGEPPWWQRLAGTIRSALRGSAAVLPDQERGLLPGLVDGDTAELDPVLEEHFRVAGLTHLVAVSGTNCTILVGSVLLVLRRARVRPWVCALFGGLVLLMFVLVARPSPSVLRAALMGGIALVALASGRPRAALPALSAAVLALLVWQPMLADSPSFALSVVATAGLLVLAPPWARALRARRVPPFVAESVAIAAAAHLVTAPIVVAISGRVSLVAIPANVLAEPVVAVITIVGFGAAVTGPWWPGAGMALAWVAGWPCRWLVHDADFFGTLDGATLPWPGGTGGGFLLLGTALVVGLVATVAGARRVLAAAGAAALVVLIPVRAATSSWPPSAWVFVACDVGQGDALLLPAGPGAAVVVDAGPDPVAIDRCLRDFGIERIPLLVITHFHRDHVDGLPGVVRGRQVDQLITSPLRDPDEGGDLVAGIAHARGLDLLSPPVGAHLEVGAVRLDVLGPAAPFHGTRSDPNNSSLVIRAEVGGVRVLLSGDAEIDEQRSIVASGADLRADVLKVAHHGSAYFDPVYLAATHASMAVISVGAGNDYGHPSPRLSTELDRLGIPIFRTDRDGDIAVAGRAGHLHAVLHRAAAGLAYLGLGDSSSEAPALGGARSVVGMHRAARP